MKVLKATVDYMDRYANDPELQLVIVDRSAPPAYIAVETGVGPSSILYVDADPCGLVTYHVHVPHNEQGYGGSVFNLQMADGSMRAIRGPWSSRAGAVNVIMREHDPNWEPIVDCLVKTEARGSYYRIGVRESIVRQIIKEHGLDIELGPMKMERGDYRARFIDTRKAKA